MEMQESESEMDAGYEGNETPAEKPVDEAPAAAPANDQAQPEAVDPAKMWEARFEKLEQRTRNAEGHIGGLNHNQKLIQETIAASRVASQKVSDAPSQAQVKDAMSNPREWDELKADFPEWANATEKLLEARIPKSKADNIDFEASFKNVADRVRAETTESVRKEIIASSLDAVFPGWEDEVRTPAFGSWMQSQPQEVQVLGSSNRVGDAAKMLRLFEASKNKPTQTTRQKRMEAAIAPKGNGGFAASRTDIDEFEAAYNKGGR